MSDASQPRSFSPAPRRKLDLRGMSPARRLMELQRLGLASPAPDGILAHTTEALAERFDGMIENAIGAFPLPLGVATNFVVNGEPRLVAMATEERSVVAAASKAAKLALPDGFAAAAEGNRTRAQIMYSRLPDPPAVLAKLRERRAVIEDLLRSECDPMKKRGGGLSVAEPRFVPGRDRDTQIVIEIVVDTVDAMGANVVTRIAERAADRLLRLFTDARPTMVICSNDDAGWRVRASATFECGGDAHAARVLDIQSFAEHDVPRCVTHNKGVMNAVSAIAAATAQDTRAIEACAHAFASRTHHYRPFTSYEDAGDGKVRGEIALVIPLGTVGGATAHPTATYCRKLMGVTRAADLASLMAAAGLAQNFAALLALAREGIPGSHARLARQRSAK